mgnify:CR=1 FL=1|jgi:nucleoside-diphosphate-sugar epimerase
MIERALVSGANGFIGSNLCRCLRQQQVPVRALVLPGEDATQLTDLGVEVMRGDITATLPAGLFAGVSHVFHLAAIPSDWGPDALFQRVNVEGTRHMLEGAASAGVPRFIHMSSLAVHRYSGHARGDENTPRDGDINAYCRTKRAAEQLVESFSGALQCTIIRPGVVPYGPGDRLSLPGIVDALERRIYLHVGGGRTRVCLSYVENLAEGMVQAAQRDGASGEAFVLCDDVVSWRTFVDAIADTFETPRARGSLPLALAWVMALVTEWAWRLLPLSGQPPLTRYRISLFRGDLVFSADKARAAFGYAPAVSLQQGLARTRDWLQARH